MNNKFDELAKGLAQSVTRRQAFKKFGLGLAGMALGCLGLAAKAQSAGTLVCCDYACDWCLTTPGKKVRVKTCAAYCYPPTGCGNCTLTGSHFVTDCSKCN